MRRLTIEEVAGLLRLHESTVRRHIRARDLGAITVGQRVFVGEDDIVQFLKPVSSVRPMSREEIRESLLRVLSARGIE